ncbi:MAG: hypothetical protein DGJ47_000458 [Rickettsiaceae bacterium]
MKIQNNNEKANFTSSGEMVYNRPQSNKFNQLLSILSFNLFKPKPVVSVLRLEGVIGKVGIGQSGLTLESMDKLITKAFEKDCLQAVCLVINSPGGSPVQSELIAKRITYLAQEKGVPVYSFVEDVAASGGYWLACAGDEIYASVSSIIGSIGVTSRGFGFAEAIKKIGIERRVYTQGKNKSVLDPFKEEQQKDIDIVKSIQKDIHQSFINHVKNSRSNRLTQDDEILFNGEFWSGQVALDYGLIDGIDDLYSFINNKFGKKVKIEPIKNKQPWFKKTLGIDSLLGRFTDSLINSADNRINNNKFDLS